MKTIRLFAIAAVLAVCASCAEELSNPEDLALAKVVEKTFVADFTPDSKTALDGTSVSWKTGDKINIIGANTNTSATAANLSENNKRASFNASVAEGDVIYAVYPYSSSLTLNNDILSMTVPSSQDGLFASANYTVAREEDGYFTFRNATAVFEFSVDKKAFPTVTSVVIESLTNIYISGQMKVEVLESSPWVDVNNGSFGSNKITVSLSSSRNQNSSAYAAVIPVTLTKGLCFHLVDANGKDVKTATLDSRINLMPNKIYRFGDLSNFEHLDSEEIYTEKFSKCKGVGGRDGKYDTCGVLIDDADSKTDISGWTFYKCFEGSDCLYIGTSDDFSYAITPSLGFSSGSNPLGLATLTFDAVRGTGKGAIADLTIIGSGFISNTAVTLGKNGFETVTAYIKNADADTRVKISGHAEGRGMFYIDNVSFSDSAPADFEYLNVPEKHFYITADATSVTIPYYADVTDGVHFSFDRYPRSFLSEIKYLKNAVQFTVVPNSTYNSTTTSVYICAYSPYLPQSESDQIVYVTQAGRSGVEPSKKLLTFPAAGAEMTVDYTLYNFDEDVEVTAESNNAHFTVSKTETGFSVVADKNMGEDPISAVLTITAEDTEHYATATVDLTQAADPIVTLDKDAIDLPSTAADTTVNVSYKNFPGTVTVTAKSNNDAFSTSVKGNVVSISAKANETDEIIEGKVAITVSDGSLSVTKDVLVSQACLRSQTLSFSETSCNAYYDGESFTAPTLSGAQTTVTYSISENDFATINPATGALTFSPVANGSATVTASAAAENGYVEATASYTLVYKRLPADYTETEGLTSDGTQYIDTGFTPDHNSRVVVDFQIVDNDRNSFIYGAAVSGGGTPEKCFAFNASSSAFYAKFGSVRENLGKPDAKEHLIDHNGSSFIFDDKTKLFDVENFTCPATMFLFHINATAPAGHVPAIATIFSCKVYDNGTLVRDFVPCTKNGTAGLYDVKNGDFYTFTSQPASE